MRCGRFVHGEGRGHDIAVIVGEGRVSSLATLPSAPNITHDDSALGTPPLLCRVEETHVRHGDTLSRRTERDRRLSTGRTSKRSLDALNQARPDTEIIAWGLSACTSQARRAF